MDIFDREGLAWIPDGERAQYKNWLEATSLLSSVFKQEYLKEFEKKGWRYSWHSGSLRIWNPDPDPREIRTLDNLRREVRRLEKDDARKIYFSHDNGDFGVTLKYLF